MADSREIARRRQFLFRSHVKFLLSVVLAFAFCFFFISSARPPSESCVRCHTDPSVMKSMVKVPTPAPAEEGAGWAGLPPPVQAETYYKGFLVDKALLDKDPHFQSGCVSCHKGDSKAGTKDVAHKGVVARPSDNLETCASCHADEAKNYGKSLHYTTSGLAHGISKRFSQTEYKAFRDKVFEKSCRSCHASCGDCHVRVPIIGDVKQGLIKNHAFVKRDEAKTCALCHGGRVYPEYTGEYAGMTDVHYEKGMTCTDCHKKVEMHGTGTAYTSRRQVQEKPTCAGCHKTGSEKNEKARMAHVTHAKNVSCSACHSAAPYTNCTECHLGKGAKPDRAFFLGRNPHDKKSVTTLRLVPVVRDTFKPAGIAMSNYDAQPNYWDATPHNIKKRTKRTRTCDACHTEKQFFLTKENLPKDGSKANLDLLYAPKPLKK